MTYQLFRGEVLTLFRSEGIEAVAVQSGSIWLTKPGEDRDYCLSQGGRISLRSAKELVIEALADATLYLAVCPEETTGPVRMTLAVTGHLHD